MTFSQTPTLNITPTEALTLIEELVSEVDNINWKGNEHGGEASGMGFAGHYTTTPCDEGTLLEITLTKKPFVVPKSLVKSQIASALEEYTV